MKKEVLVIFKTHLDIGFTDFANNILQKYLNEYIPNAIRVGYELKDTDTPFVWTVGSFLLWHALKHDTDGKVEKAISDGILRWHALPFTTHTELMSPTLFSYGLSLCKRLDERFGTQTISAKMTDVPGHTRGIVPILKRNGVEFLHIGVNPATPLPKVPPLFRWKYGKDEIVVMYQGDYGEEYDLGNCILSFAHTGDNLGPQNAGEIVSIFRHLRKKYPECTVRIATLNDLAIKLREKENLPVIEAEIGDTWIHGLGTDPYKVSCFRRVQRALEEYTGELPDLSDNLLLVPEHTWGLNMKRHFPYDGSYSHEDVLRMRRECSGPESSWEEQRNYVKKAEELLGISPEPPSERPDLSGYRATEIPTQIGLELSFQLFDRSDYDRYIDEYMRSLSWWAIQDFTKVGLPDYQGGTYVAKVIEAYACGEKRLYRMDFDKNIKSFSGLPEFYVQIDRETVQIRWFGKLPSRFPQAFWLKFTGYTEAWELNKMGQWISPKEILGSPFISGIDQGVRNEDVLIESLDCPLVAPYGRRLLQFGKRPRKEDLYFNLYNNIWNTNFPMWYSDDAIFRFRISKRKF